MQSVEVLKQRKDYRGALSDYKKSLSAQLDANYKKRVQQLLCKQGSSNSKGGKVSKKRAAQAAQYAKRGNSKAKKKDYVGALKDYQRAAKLNPTAANQRRVKQLTNIVDKSGPSSTEEPQGNNAKSFKYPNDKPVKYANDIYNIAEELFEMSTANFENRLPVY